MLQENSPDIACKCCVILLRFRKYRQNPSRVTPFGRCKLTTCKLNAESFMLQGNSPGAACIHEIEWTERKSSAVCMFT